MLQVRPAPAVPPDIQGQYDVMQHCLYLLRCAHLTGRLDEPVKALASAQLVDVQELQFEDPLIAAVGVGPWLQYMEASWLPLTILFLRATSHGMHWTIPRIMLRELLTQEM